MASYFCFVTFFLPLGLASSLYTNFQVIQLLPIDPKSYLTGLFLNILVCSILNISFTFITIINDKLLGKNQREGFQARNNRLLSF